MAISYIGAAPAVSGAAQTFSGDLVWPDSTQTDLILAVFGFEDVTTGPYIQYDPTGAHGVIEGTGWVRLLTVAPSATGCGLEVWAGFRGTGSATAFLFTGTYDYVARGLQYRGEYNPGGVSYVDFVNGNGTVRAYTTDQVTGDDPACPAVYAFVDELLIALAADQLTTPGFGTPTPPGWTSRVDSKRGGSFGNVEITAADRLVTVEGDTGAIAFDATADPSGAKGTTATLAIRPAAALVATTAPYVSVEFPVVTP